jgi:hypothetical protein
MSLTTRVSPLVLQALDADAKRPWEDAAAADAARFQAEAIALEKAQH